VGLRSDRAITERILNVLRPYASNWSGTLGRGDLVIPQREIPRVIHEILDALHDDGDAHKEAGDRELFDVLMAARRSASVQDQAHLLRRHFLILLR
jgi:hypothetical protein